jgi:hypothetical protein
MKTTIKFSRKKKNNSLCKRIAEKKRNDTLVHVKNDVIDKESVEKVATMNDVFVSRSLKLRIALLTLQKNDQLAQRMRSYCAESQSMKRNFENESEDDSLSSRVLSDDEATAQQISKN